MRKAPWSAALLLALMAVPPSFALAGQITGRQNPPLVIPSVSGRDLFEFYCATCHGREGKGGGPAVRALTSPPPDLTRIGTRNGGVFPRAQVEAFVRGDQSRPVPAHGSKDMPVWGPIFRGLDANATLNDVRISNLVEYIATLQAR